MRAAPAELRSKWLTPHQPPAPSSACRSQEASLRIFKIITDNRAATAIEYGLIAALIAMACMIAFQSLGLNLADVFNNIAGNL